MSGPSIPRASFSPSWLEVRQQFLHRHYLLFEAQLKAVPPGIRSAYDMMLLDLQMAENHLQQVRDWYQEIEEGKLP